MRFTVSKFFSSKAGFRSQVYKFWSIHMRRLTSKLSLRASLVASSILVTFLLFAAMTVVLDNRRAQAQMQNAQAQQDTGMRILTAVFTDRFDDMDVVYDRFGNVSSVSWDSIPTFESHELIDRVGEISGETATLFVWDPVEADFIRRSTNIIKPDGERAIGTALGQTSPLRAVMLNKQTYRGEATILGKPYLTIYQPLLNSSGDVVGILYVGVDKTMISANIAMDRQINVIFGIAIIFVGSLLLVYTIPFLLKPLSVIAKRIEDVANGNFTESVPYTQRTDQIGTIAQKLDIFQVSLQQKADLENAQKQRDLEQQEVVEAISYHLSLLSQGDLMASIDTQFPPTYEKLRTDFNQTVNGLHAAMQDVVSAAGSIRNGADDIGSASDELSNRTENQAATLEQTAAALDELTASVKSAAEGAKSIEEIVLEAQSEAEASSEVVGDAIAAMTEIEKSSDQISQIIGVIDDIAFQTNLLALNAGVEAARAGEAGKGFAVVASEVRALAQRSTDAAKEIKTLISGSTKQVERGVSLVGGAGTALESIAKRVTHITELVRSMAAGTSEQATGLGEINIGVNQLDQVTQQNAAMVEESTAASHTLKLNASRLQDLVSRFKTSSNPMGASAAEPSSHAANVSHVQFRRAASAKAIQNPEQERMKQTANGISHSGAGAGDWLDF
jgi:methyl-accepting chemotaxis protein